MIEELLKEVEELANNMTDVVVLRLLEKLTVQLNTISPLDCQKHTVLQIAASIAAIRLWRFNKRNRDFLMHCGGWKDSSGPLERYQAESARESTSRAYHEAECTCGLTRKERKSLFSNSDEAYLNHRSEVVSVHR